MEEVVVDVSHLLSSLPFCLLCKVNIHALETPLLAPCGHIFCRKCIRSYRFQRSVKCPVDQEKVKISLIKECPDILEVNSILKNMLHEFMTTASPEEKKILACSVTSLVDNMHKTFAMQSAEVRLSWTGGKQQAELASVRTGSLPTLQISKAEFEDGKNRDLVQRVYEKYAQKTTKAINAPRRAPSLCNNELTMIFQKGQLHSDHCEECKTLVATVTCLCKVPFLRYCEKCSIKHVEKKSPVQHCIEPVSVFNLITPPSDLSRYTQRKKCVEAIKSALQSNFELIDTCKSDIERVYQVLVHSVEEWRNQSLTRVKELTELVEEALKPVLKEINNKKYEKEFDGETLIETLLDLQPEEVAVRRQELLVFSYSLAPSMSLEKALSITFQDENLEAMKKPASVPGLRREPSFHGSILGAAESSSQLPITGELPVSITPAVRATESLLGLFDYGPDRVQNVVTPGPIQLSNGAVYLGEWNASSQRHGRGIQIMTDGSKFEGWWMEDKAHGLGRLITANGDVYTGDWEHSMANGYGSMSLTDGTTYEGNWSQDLQDGQGVEIWADGTTFQGTYSQGKKNGHGKYEYESGNVYEGNFEEDAISGSGVYRWVDGRRYDGQWKDNMMHGFGKFSWPDGRQYVGSYVCDKKHGDGELVHSDGRRYKGSWRSGLQHGIGLFVGSDGTSRKGEWSEGRWVRWVS